MAEVQRACQELADRFVGDDPFSSFMRSSYKVAATMTDYTKRWDMIKRLGKIYDGMESVNGSFVTKTVLDDAAARAFDKGWYSKVSEELKEIARIWMMVKEDCPVKQVDNQKHPKLCFKRGEREAKHAA